MNPYIKIICNYIRSGVSGEEDVLDIAQETMLAVWRALKNFDGNSTFKTWILGIARHKITDFYRFAYRYASEPIEEYEDTLTAGDDYEPVLSRTVVNDALKVLNRAERELVFLVFNAQLSYSQISAITSVPEGTVKSRMSAIKAKLKKQIGGE